MRNYNIPDTEDSEEVNAKAIELDRAYFQANPRIEHDSRMALDGEFDLRLHAPFNLIKVVFIMDRLNDILIRYAFVSVSVGDGLVHYYLTFDNRGTLPYKEAKKVVKAKVDEMIKYSPDLFGIYS